MRVSIAAVVGIHRLVLSSMTTNVCRCALPPMPKAAGKSFLKYVGPTSPPQTRVVHPRKGSKHPQFNGTAQEFIDAHLARLKGVSAEKFRQQVYNRVRQCPSCQKNCGETMVICNGCGANISKVACSSTINVFACFIFGVAKLCSRTLQIFIRKENERMIAMDDMNAMGPIHQVIIPTEHYIPNVLYMLEHPKEGLALLESMEFFAWDVIESQFLSHSEFFEFVAKQVPRLRVGSEGSEVTHDVIRERNFVFCFNLPPSQFQLHLQCIFNPILSPLRKDCASSHFKPGRCFPLKFVQSCLRKMVTSGIEAPCARTWSSADFIHFAAEKLSVSYENHMQDLFANLYATFEDAEFYSEENGAKVYDYTIVHDEDDRVVRLKTGETVADIDRSWLDCMLREDKASLCNFGPHPSDMCEGDHGGRYYSFAKKAPLPLWMSPA